MAKRNIKFNLDFSNKDILPKFNIKQFDNALITISTYLEGNVFNPTGNTCKLYVSIGKEVFLQESNISVLENKIEIDLDKNIVGSHGKALGELELTDPSGAFTSTTFIFDIEPKVGEGATIPGGVEGFVALHERLIREFKEEINPKIDVINNSISNINIKDNEQDNRLEQIESKNIEQDTRLKDIEYTNKRQGVVINGLFNENTDGRLSIEGEGNDLKLEGSKDGLVDVELEGLSLNNLFPNTQFAETVNYPFVKMDITKFKFDTKYTFMLMGDLSNYKSVYLGSLDDTEIVIPRTYSSFFAFTTSLNINEFTKDMRLILYNNGKDFTAEMCRSFKVIILEGDYTNKSIPSQYFEGLQSTFEDKLITQEMVDSGLEKAENLGKYRADLKVVGKNKFDIAYLKEYIISENLDTVTLDYMEMHQGGFSIDLSNYGNVTFSYKCKANIEGKNPRFAFVYEDSTVESINNKTSTEMTYYSRSSNTTKKVKSLQIAYTSRDGNWTIDKNSIQLEEGTQATQYEPYKEYKTSILLDEPLRGIEGRAKDRVAKREDKLYAERKCNEVVLNGNENWTKYGDLGKCLCFYYKLPNQYGGSYSFINDKLQSIHSFDDTDHIHINDTGLHITIEKSKLETQDVTGFKKWLQANPIKVIYELAEPYFEPITPTLPRWVLDCFNDCTLHIDSNIPVSSVRATYTGNIPSVYKIENDISTIEEQNVDIVATSFDMDYRLLEVEWTLEEITGTTGFNLFNILTKGVSNMALSRYEMAKIMILGGAYEKETLTRQLTRYLEKKIITQQEYDELISLMEAKDLVVGE